MEVTDEEFDHIISDALDQLPQRYLKNLKNLAIVFADEPTPEQRHKLRLHPMQTLYGLYEGAAGAHRIGMNNMLLPDKITIFKNPIAAVSNTKAEMIELVRHTVWHEIAHYYGLDHKRIDELDKPL